MGPHCFPEKPRTQVNFLALMRAFQHLTVAIEHVLSAALRPPKLPPKTEVLASQRGAMGVLASEPHTADVATFNAAPTMMLAPWTLIPGSLPARTCSALWFSNTSPLVGTGGRGRHQGRVLGKPHFQLLTFKAPLVLSITFKA